jgi:uncharacterized membrane protein YhaH (DUF805 family)
MSSASQPRGFVPSVKACLGKYATFSGRAARSEYWWFFLFVVLVSLVAAVLDSVFFTTAAPVEPQNGTAPVTVSNQPVQSVTALALMLPKLAVAWRRMHDTGRSGLYALFPLLLICGAIAVLVFGIGIADLFVSGGNLDILFTRLTLLIVIPTLVILLVSPLVMLWWLTRPSQPQPNTYGPVPNGTGG